MNGTCVVSFLPMVTEAVNSTDRMIENTLTCSLYTVQDLQWYRTSSNIFVKLSLSLQKAKNVCCNAILMRGRPAPRAPWAPVIFHDVARQQPMTTCTTHPTSEVFKKHRSSGKKYVRT